MPLLDLMKGLVPVVSSGTLRTGGSKRRLKRRRSERLSVNCKRNDAVLDMKGSEGPECWSNGNESLDLSIFFMLNPGESAHVNDDGSISTAPTDDYTSQDSIYVDDATIDSRKQDAVYLEFDPHVSRDLGLDALKSPDSESRKRQTSNWSKTRSCSVLTEQDVKWPKKKSVNPYNEFLARKYDRGRIERALNLFCPPDEDESMDDSDSTFFKKESSFKTINSKVLEEFSIEAYGASRPNSAGTNGDDDVSSLKVLLQSSRSLVRAKVQMPELPIVVDVIQKNEIVDDGGGMSALKPPSGQVTCMRPAYETIIQESKSNLTVSSPTGIDDFEHWNERNKRSDELLIEVKQNPKKDTAVNDHVQKVFNARQEGINIHTSEGRDAQLEQSDSHITNIAELRSRMRRIAAEYGTSSKNYGGNKHHDEGQSIDTEASSILELKSRLRLLESSFRHYQKALICS